MERGSFSRCSCWPNPQQPNLSSPRCSALRLGSHLLWGRARLGPLPPTLGERPHCGVRAQILPGFAAHTRVHRVQGLGRTGIASGPASPCGRAACLVGAGWKFQTNGLVLFTAFFPFPIQWLVAIASQNYYPCWTARLQSPERSLQGWCMRRSRGNLTILGCPQSSCARPRCSSLDCQFGLWMYLMAPWWHLFSLHCLNTTFSLIPGNTFSF